MSNDPYISVEDIKFFASFASLFWRRGAGTGVYGTYESVYIVGRVKSFFSTVPELEILTVIHPSTTKPNHSKCAAPSSATAILAACFTCRRSLV